MQCNNIRRHEDGFKAKFVAANTPAVKEHLTSAAIARLAEEFILMDWTMLQDFNVRAIAKHSAEFLRGFYQHLGDNYFPEEAAAYYHAYAAEAEVREIVIVMFRIDESTWLAQFSTYDEADCLLLADLRAVRAGFARRLTA